MNPTSTTRIYRGATRIDAISPEHRGIAYGDGLFETMRVHAGGVHWWQRHWARLASGAARLRIDLPDQDHVTSEIASLLDGQGDGVLKLIVARGAGGRGYAPSPDAQADWQLALHPLPPPQGAISLRWCALRLADQPLLAGLKHCNRLEQVLARAEWLDPDADDRDAAEGLLCDQAGDVVCATAANLFVLHGTCWRTPMLDRCGVAGICRGWAIEALGAGEARFGRAEVASADAVFLCNAVRGILPVSRLGTRTFAAHPEIARVRRLLADAHPAFAMEPS